MICVNASVAIKWLVREYDSDLALRLLSILSARGEQLIAPTIMPFEISNILWRQCVSNGMSPNVARNLLADFLTTEITFIQDVKIHDQALAITAVHRLPATYDAHYLALCQRVGCDFWTADKRLLNALRGRLPFVRDLASFADDAIGPSS